MGEYIEREESNQYENAKKNSDTKVENIDILGYAVIGLRRKIYRQTGIGESRRKSTNLSPSLRLRFYLCRTLEDRNNQGEPKLREGIQRSLIASPMTDVTWTVRGGTPRPRLRERRRGEQF